MNKLFLSLRGLNAHEVKVHSGFYSAGLPAMTAWAGMGHAVGLELAKKAVEAFSAPADAKPARGFGVRPSSAPVAFAVVGTCPVINTYQASPGPARRASYGHNERGKPAPVTYCPLADLTFDVVLAIQTSLSATQTESLLTKGAARAALDGQRISGAALFGNCEFDVCASYAEALSKSAGSAFLLEDATDVLTKARAEDPTRSVASLIDALTARPASRSTQADAPTTPRYLACGVGYRGLEDPVQREGSRYGLPHAYAEPVVGLIRPRVLASVLKQIEKEEGCPVLWSHRPPRNNYYVVTGSTPT